MSIDLTELRAEAQAYIDRQDLWDNAENAQAYVSAHDLLALIAIAEAARGLHELVEMDESVGKCLSDRTPSLRLRDALARITP